MTHPAQSISPAEPELPSIYSIVPPAEPAAAAAQQPVPEPPSPNDGLSAYERERLANISRNEEVLRGLGLLDGPSLIPAPRPAPAPKRPRAAAAPPPPSTRRLRSSDPLPSASYRSNTVFAFFSPVSGTFRAS